MPHPTFRRLPGRTHRAARHAVLAGAAALAALTLPLAASAAGNHAGGHVHGQPGETTAIGEPGEAGRVDRTIAVDMTDDMRFTPADIAVRQGETVRFALRNAGRLAHELVLGTEEDLKAHDAAMAQNPGMAHADPRMLTLAPGRSGEIVWRFTQGGRVDFACLQPGHYAAGMKGRVMVATTALAAPARPAEASASATGESARPAASATPPGADDGFTEGEVRRIDRETGSLTLRHGPLRNLDMPGMTMVFAVADAAMLDRLRPGERVRFQAGKVDGRFVVTRVETASPSTPAPPSPAAAR